MATGPVQLMAHRAIIGVPRLNQETPGKLVAFTQTEALQIWAVATATLA